MVHSIPVRHDHMSKHVSTSRLQAAPSANRSNRRPNRFLVPRLESQPRYSTGAFCVHRLRRNLRAPDRLFVGDKELLRWRLRRRTGNKRRLGTSQRRPLQNVSVQLSSTRLVDVEKSSTDAQNCWQSLRYEFRPGIALIKLVPTIPPIALLNNSFLMSRKPDRDPL